MGGILFSDKFTGSPVQAIEWHKSVIPHRLSHTPAHVLTCSFIGSNRFCLKACDPAGANAKHFCEHIYDRIGCDYNAPNAARDQVFESCDGDNQDFPGVYVEAGVTRTYTQPAESLGPITSIGYTARIPASSNCQTFSSAAIYTGLPSAAAVVSTTSTSGTAAATTTTGASAATGSTAATRTASSGSASAAQASSTSGGASLHFSCLAVAGAVISAIFLS